MSALSGIMKTKERLQRNLFDFFRDGTPMDDGILRPQIFEELKFALQRGFASGDLMTPEQIDQQTKLFRGRFGPAVLREVDGDALLRAMHGRESVESRCLAYWLEFKNDSEFAGDQFGKIGGGWL